jgi:hypothetical protein
MAVSGTFTYNSAVGIREDLEDVIYRLDPTETPFFSAIGKTKADAKYHEWQVQKLAAVNAVQSLAGGATVDAALDGAAAATASTTPTVRVGNRTQIMTRTASVSGGLQAADTAGRANEMEYQVLLKGLELRRQIEAQLCQNQASQTDDGTHPGLLGSFESWLVTNVSRGATGASSGFSAGQILAPTDGTQRAFSEALLKTVLAAVYTAGGKPSTLFLGTTQKQNFSAFAGIAGIRMNMTDKSNQMAKIVGAADIYVSDFGQLAVVPDIFQRNRSALILSPKYAKVAYFRPMRNWPLAKVGDADQRQLLVEFTLEMCNEAAHGIVADLT